MAFLFFLFLYHLLLLLILPDFVYSKCPKSFQCGDHFPLQFPFTDFNNPKCGVFKVGKCSESKPVIHFDGSLFYYHFLGMNSPNKIKVFDPYFRLLLDQTQPRCFSFIDILPKSPSYSLSIPSNLTLFTCANRTLDHHIQNHFKEYRSYYQNQACEFHSATVYYSHPASAAKKTSIPANCGVIQLPVNSSKSNAHQLFDLLTAEFTLEWNVSEACYKCHHQGGHCSLNSRHQFICKKGKKFSNFMC